MEIDKKLENLVSNGSSISRENLINLRKFLISIKKKNTLSVLENLTEELEIITNCFLSSKVIKGISTSITTNSYDLSIYGGENIQYNTEYDIASITKLFTLILVLKCIENGLIKANDRICDINPNFRYLDYTINDLIKMSGTIKTDGRIDSCNNLNNALEKLFSTHPVSYDKSINNYTDIGFMVLSKILEDIINKPFKDIIINFYKEHGIIINQMKNIKGNGHDDLKPHDPKARIMGLIGSAGVFIDIENIKKLSEKIFNYEIISEENLRKLSQKLFQENHPNKGLAGIYIKHPLGIKKTSTPLEYSKYAFSHQGYTGSCVIMDPTYKICNSILVDAIKETGKKDINFYKYFNEFHQKYILITLKCFLLEQDTKIKIIRKI